MVPYTLDCPLPTLASSPTSQLLNRGDGAPFIFVPSQPLMKTKVSQLLFKLLECMTFLMERTLP